MLNCENMFCIYNDEHGCILEKPTLNSAGSCEDCIIANIPSEILQKYKWETLKDLSTL